MTSARDIRLGSMRVLSRSVRTADRFGDSIEFASQFEEDLRRGLDPDLEAVWMAGGGSLALLSALVKVEIRARFERGERPSVRAYLDRYPALREADERVISLVYEEYCLLEEGGEQPSVEAFCDRYLTWADSLASQLRYHRLLSQVAIVGPTARAAPPAYPQPGQWFAGQFLVRRLLGSGGAGRVYLADQPDFERQVALKVSSDLGREHAIQGRLDHDHVMPVWSVVKDDQTGLRGLCMPFRPGCPLDVVIRHVHEFRRPAQASDLLRAVDERASQWVPNDGWGRYPLDAAYPQGVAWVGQVIARALAHAHGRGVVHRDVKPANVFLAAREGPQLLDFNLSHAPSSAEQAKSARSGGTLPYMAPEQLEAFLDPERWSDVGPAADIYALGLVMAEMLTGARPDGPDPDLPLPRAIRDLLDRRALPAVSPRMQNPDVPHSLACIVLKCLEHDPARRYPSAKALAADLQRFLDDQPLREVQGVPRSERTARWFRRNRRALSTIGLVVALCVPLAVGLDAWRQSSIDPSVFVSSGNDRLEQARLLQQKAAAISNELHGLPARLKQARLIQQKALYDQAQTAFAEAQADFLEARRLDPQLYTAYASLGILESEANQDFDRAIELFQRGLELATRPGSHAPADAKANLLKNLAIAYLRKAREGNEAWQTDPLATERLAQARKAVSLLKEASQLGTPNDPLELRTKLGVTIQLALSQGLLGDGLTVRQQPRAGAQWYHSAVVDALRARELAQEVERFQTWKPNVDVCNSILASLRKRVPETQPTREANKTSTKTR